MATFKASATTPVSAVSSSVSGAVTFSRYGSAGTVTPQMFACFCFCLGDITGAASTTNRPREHEFSARTRITDSSAFRSKVSVTILNLAAQLQGQGSANPVLEGLCSSDAASGSTCGDTVSDQNLTRGLK